MARYIDAEKLIVFSFDDESEETIMKFVPYDFIKDAPTADVVEVVRCKDCKWQDKGENECESWNMCRHNVIEHLAIYDEHFCEWGERREE